MNIGAQTIWPCTLTRWPRCPDRPKPPQGPYHGSFQGERDRRRGSAATCTVEGADEAVSAGAQPSRDRAGRARFSSSSCAAADRPSRCEGRRSKREIWRAWGPAGGGGGGGGGGPPP